MEILLNLISVCELIRALYLYTGKARTNRGDVAKETAAGVGSRDLCVHPRLAAEGEGLRPSLRGHRRARVPAIIMGRKLIYSGFHTPKAVTYHTNTSQYAQGCDLSCTYCTVTYHVPTVMWHMFYIV